MNRRSFECLLAELCAPTLARLKPASLFRYQPQPGEDVRAAAAFWDGALAPRGVSVRILKECPNTGAVLVYVHRPAQVARILEREVVQRFLAGEGYEPGPCGAILEQLSGRLCCDGAFPHEIGVFLGYPLTDVVGFIENKGRNFTYCGYWKSYGDPAECRACFARYKRCEQIYRRHFDNGAPLQKLCVAA